MEEKVKKYQLNKVNFNQPITIPRFSESFTRAKYVNYGADNMMPNYLINRFNLCSIHKAVIETKKTMTCGDKIISPKNPIVTITPVNGSEMLEEVFSKAALDYILFGGYALNVIWSKDGKSVAEIYHIDFSKVRSGKINPETDRVDTYYVSPDWTNTRKFPPKEYPRFDQNNNDPNQILYSMDYSPDSIFYPVPTYSGALSAIEIDIAIKSFHNANLKNGLNPSLFVSFNNGIPSDEDKEVITRSLESQYGGTEQAGTAVISFSDSKETEPTITQIGTNGSDNYYSSLYEDVNRSILSGHKVSSSELFGISTAGKLGTGTEIIEHSEFFRNTVIKPIQGQLLDTFNKLLTLKYDKPIKLEIVPLTILELENIKKDDVEIKPETSK